MHIMAYHILNGDVLINTFTATGVNYVMSPLKMVLAIQWVFRIIKEEEILICFLKRSPLVCISGYSIHRTGRHIIHMHLAKGVYKLCNAGIMTEYGYCIMFVR